MRFESLFWAGMIAVAALGLLRTEAGEAAPQSTAGAAEALVVETFEATAVELRNLTGKLRVEVILEGASSDLTKIDRLVEAGTLVIDGSDLGSAMKSSSVVVGALSVSMIDGGAGQRTSGEDSLDRAGRSTALRMLLRLPRGLSLKVLGHQGDVVSDDLEGPFVMELIAGKAQLGQIRDARLSLTGAGSISAREALGNLSIAVAGDGEVRIAESLLEHLEVGVTGEGAVAVGGRARFASLSLVGAGRIFLAEAERQPVINRIGAGEIVIGKAR
jgi:hypothetical protein